MMQSEWPTKHTNDTKRSSSGQNQSGFHLTYPWTESENESPCIHLIFVLFVCFVGRSSAWIRLSALQRRSPKSVNGWPGHIMAHEFLAFLRMTVPAVYP
jgi:hypothetical protein